MPKSKPEPPRPRARDAAILAGMPLTRQRMDGAGLCPCQTRQRSPAARPVCRTGGPGAPWPPRADAAKVFTAIRLDADLLQAFKATGKGQTDNECGVAPVHRGASHRLESRQG